MRKLAIAACFSLFIAVILGVTGSKFVRAQPPIKRVDLLNADLGMEGKEMHVWTADIPAGAATGRHYHSTPRFVVVLEGSVVYEVDGKSPQTFTAGQAYQELPNDVHNFRNASTTQPAKAIGIQCAGKGEPLQTNAR